jgi:hypothetical protein
MIRALIIPLALAALAVSAAPASAGYVANHTEGTVSVRSFTVDMATVEKFNGYLGTPDAPLFGVGQF